MNRLVSVLGLGLLCCNMSCLTALAADRPELQPGITMGEVLVRWGQPIERIERESQRRELWVYPTGNVSFFQGTVVDYPGLANTNDAPRKVGPMHAVDPQKAVAQPATAQVGQALAPQDSASDSSQLEDSSADVISDVLRQIPSGEEDKSQASRPSRSAIAVPLRATPSNLPPPIDPSVVEEMSNDEMP